MKNIIVQKYGGSSLVDSGKIKQVAELIKKRQDQGFRICVVVSAMGKTTNTLIEQANQINKDPPRREMDMLLSCGERVTVALLAMALSQIKVKCISFTGSQSGIITNDAHTGARILEVRPYRVQDELEKNTVVIVAGFQGVSYKKEITTLGRGGSDTTAVALAAALGAQACEIYSDVDGVYSADPRIVENTIKLEELSYEQMEELAVGGAKVLAPQAIAFAKAKNIALFARKTASDNSGTIIRKDIDWNRKKVVAVSAHASLYHLQVDKSQLIKALQILEQQKLQLNFSFQNYAGLYSLCLSKDYVLSLKEQFNELDNYQLNEIGVVTCLFPSAEEHIHLLNIMHIHIQTIGLKVLHMESTPLSIRFFVESHETLKLTQNLHALLNK